jgi:hypothetical protein
MSGSSQPVSPGGECTSSARAMAPDPVLRHAAQSQLKGTGSNNGALAILSRKSRLVATWVLDSITGRLIQTWRKTATDAEPPSRGP